MKRFTITAENRDQVIPIIGKYIRNLNLEEHQSVVVKDYKRNRSTEQNSRLWAIYKIIGNELGYTKEEIHSLMRYKFLGMRTIEVAGELIEELPSTTELKTAEMAEYQNEIERWAGTMGIRLPAREYE